jgi:hypothetical protein
MPAQTSPNEQIHSPRLILAAIAIMLLLASLDQTIVSTALPTIVSELGGIEHLSWVVTAYLLTSTVVAPLYGKLGDLYGRKLMMQISVVLFLLGSALAGQATSMLFLIAARGLQGLGGGGLFVLALTVIADVVPPRERGKIQGLFGAVFSISSIAGPLIGGYFTQHLSWRWIFYVNLPLGIFALVVFAMAFKPRGIRTGHKIDYLGALLLTTALSSVVLFTSLGGRTYAWDSGFILSLIALAVLTIPAFVLVELFRHRCHCWCRDVRCRHLPAALSASGQGHQPHRIRAANVADDAGINGRFDRIGADHGPHRALSPPAAGRHGDLDPRYAQPHAVAPRHLALGAGGDDGDGRAWHGADDVGGHHRHSERHPARNAGRWHLGVHALSPGGRLGRHRCVRRVVLGRAGYANGGVAAARGRAGRLWRSTGGSTA